MRRRGKGAGMIFITGATGFVGGHLVRFLSERSIPSSCLVRSRRRAHFPEGVEIVEGDVTSPESLRGLISAGDFVVHLVGIIEEKGAATFQKVHVEGTRALVAEAVRCGAGHFFYQSALGADAGSWSGYLRTKAEAEEIVKQSGLPWTIFRPSLIIGPWDGFTKKMIDLIKISPVLPIPGEGSAKFQPVFIDDWLRCIEKVLQAPGVFGAVYEIGGPEHLTYRAIVETLARSMGSMKPAVAFPMGLMKFGASLLEKLLPGPPVTSDQLRLLEQDNVTDPDAVMKHFGFTPLRYADALKTFVLHSN